MSVAIMLDAGPLGLLTNPNQTPLPVSCRHWLREIKSAGRRVIVPEIADYEVRRELLRIQSWTAVTNLDAYGMQLEYLPLTTSALRLAAQFWANLRNLGLQTASPHALDGDVILAAQAHDLNIPCMVASDNVSHLTRLVSADLWTNITP